MLTGGGKPRRSFDRRKQRRDDMSNERTYDPDDVRPSEEGIIKVLKEGNQMATDAIIELKQERIEKLCAKNRYLKAMTEQQREEYSELKAGFDRLNTLVKTWTDRSKDMRKQRDDARQGIAELEAVAEQRESEIERLKSLIECVLPRA
jgi:predicted RNase H-like nuclease (RuvC/YqgF family)